MTERRRYRMRALAAGSLALVLIVVVASAAIRQGGDELGAWLPLVRATQRICASAATLLIALLAWFTWRSARRALAAALLAVTAALAVIGALTGTAAPPAAQAANLLGGLLLAALLARLLAKGAVHDRLLALVAVQAALGAWLAIFASELWSWSLALHALLGLGVALGAIWLALRCESAALRVALVLAAMATPAAGIAAALFELALAATLAHAGAAALLVCTIAYTALDTHQGKRAGAVQSPPL